MHLIMQVKIDGEPIAELNLNSLRNLIGLVSQEPVLFETTIEENIRFGNPKASMEDIIKACTLANIRDFISTLPDVTKPSVDSTMLHCFD